MLCDTLPPKRKALERSICVSWSLWFGIWEQFGLRLSGGCRHLRSSAGTRGSISKVLPSTRLARWAWLPACPCMSLHCLNVLTVSAWFSPE